MKSTLCMTFLVIGLMSITQGQTTPAAAVTTVKAQMLNPDSFVLESIGTYSTKKVTDAVFMTYRSQNRAGGFSEGCAMVADYKGKPRVEIPDGDYSQAICAQNSKRITKWLEVKDLK